MSQRQRNGFGEHKIQDTQMRKLRISIWPKGACRELIWHSKSISPAAAARPSSFAVGLPFSDELLRLGDLHVRYLIGHEVPSFDSALVATHRC
jgi:hypothetical protein